MKKIKLFLIVVFVVGWQMTYSQNLKIRKGDFTAKMGVGVLPTFLQDKKETILPPLNVTFGYHVAKTFSLGGYLGYSSTRSVVSNESGELLNDFTNNMLMLGLRMEAHSDRFDDFEIYGGFMLGYAKSFIRYEEAHANYAFRKSLAGDQPYMYSRPTGKVFISGFVGGTYYLVKNIGVYAEVGYGVSIFNVGVNFKL